jgi:signal transduction histidine kinase
LAIDCDVDVAGARLSQELETTVYRLVQEALTNVVKHARAEHAAVRVTARAAELELEVSDDGHGFDRGAAVGGFGLAGMRERVALNGGVLEIRPASPGTVVRAVLALSTLGAADAEPPAHAASA